MNILASTAEEDAASSAPEKSLTEIYQDIFMDGGVFMWLIIATSVVLIAVVLYKLITLNRKWVIPDNSVVVINQFAEQPNDDNAVSLQRHLEYDSSTLGKL